ncbi:hypothetical protein [Xenorhabdus ehlersii]|uniref:Uncharacterized protein n=1 Tax=Xenorhabdus ehlersii TaxID=290111 RepID=A0A2D0IMD1_9GAMM|nr:hypothetical protein [Xenorhabdus ehlersii]PHM22983.1 hypothetical protein Xehl_03217 [Xenorhabdus ehlersii]RKE92651.1 hypothetical protein BDE27_0307 [Xenorhabdus ehlersii]
MEHANARKTRNASKKFISNHLLSSVLQPIRDITQQVIASNLGVADSTITRRIIHFPKLTEIMAEAGITDLVMKGERKIGEEEYRYWITRMMQASIQNLELNFNGEVKISNEEYRYLLKQQIELSEIKLRDVI